MSLTREGPNDPNAIGKGRPPKASRWKKGQSGNPKGKTARAPDDAEFIEREFRRPCPVIEGGEKAIKTNFAVIHARLLMKESAGNRRAGRTRDRYEAFARADAGTGGVLLRYVVSDPAPNPAARVEPVHGVESRLETGTAPDDAKERNDLNVDAPADVKAAMS
jgi:Family of unknown function (DUF5681)